VADEKKKILVAGSRNPARAAALELALRDCVERNGWGERFAVHAVGMGAGAGRLPARDITVLLAAGLGEPVKACSDFENSPDLLTGVCAVVAEDERTAAHLIGYKELGRADLVRLDEAFPEFARAPAGNVDDDSGRDLSSDLTAFVEVAPELLRLVLANLASEFAPLNA
jgi:hypothetical protein